jgi:hypothetical protein
MNNCLKFEVFEVFEILNREDVKRFFSHSFMITHVHTGLTF